MSFKFQYEVHNHMILHFCSKAVFVPKVEDNVE